MSRTCEAVAPHLSAVKRAAIGVPTRQFTANWQSGFESGDHIQRKVRLTFADVAAERPVNRRSNMHARHFDSESHNEAMKRFVFASAVMPLTGIQER